MYEQIEKSNENKCRSVANFVAQNKSNVKQGFGFVDNRPEAITQRKLQEVAKNSLQEEQVVPIQRVLSGPLEKINYEYLKVFNVEFPQLVSFKNRQKVLATLKGMEAVITSDDDLLREIPNALTMLGLAGRAPDPVRREPEVARPEPEPLAAREEPVTIRPQPEVAREEPVRREVAAAESAAREEREVAEHSPGAHNIVNSGADETYVLIPKFLEIKNLFRGDSRSREVLATDGFQPGSKPRGYVDKLSTFLRTRSKAEAETDARTMISREQGRDINESDGRKRPPTDLVYSLTKIEVDGGKKITLLNYVCSGPETGAGSTSYLIKVDEVFTCISASPTTGLYQSPSGVQIVAVSQSANSRTGTVKFTEYDFLTPIPAGNIYYASNDGGETQADSGSSWFRVTDRDER